MLFIDDSVAVVSGDYGGSKMDASDQHDCVNKKRPVFIR